MRSRQPAPARRRAGQDRRGGTALAAPDRTVQALSAHALQRACDPCIARRRRALHQGGRDRRARPRRR
ncbi:hypothetical protein, partial [Mesorhizobium sp.]|uniref:hypothetical protein n=1 Tax=Mesorhizobium sp. TaxID=1871066 RepID=UPI00344DA8BB